MSMVLGAKGWALGVVRWVLVSGASWVTPDGRVSTIAVAAGDERWDWEILKLCGFLMLKG